MLLIKTQKRIKELINSYEGSNLEKYLRETLKNCKIEEIIEECFKKVYINAGGVEEEFSKVQETPWAVDNETWKTRVRKYLTALYFSILNESKRARIFKYMAQIEKYINSFAKKLKRMMLTEKQYFHSMGIYYNLKKEKAKYFKFVAVLDARTSDICRSMNGKVFPMKDFKIGITVPPLHPNCRSVIIPATENRVF